jgi:hypothetical protein
LRRIVPATACPGNTQISRQNVAYGTPAGTTLMLLNGEPLISFVLTTV